MMSPDELDEMALSVADGAPVDWDRMLAVTGLTAEVGALRLIEAIAAALRADPTPTENR